MPTAVCGIPYEGAKEMLLVDETDDKEFLIKLIKAMYDELPLPKRKNKSETTFMTYVNKLKNKLGGKRND